MKPKLGRFKYIVVLNEDPLLSWAAQELSRILCLITGEEKQIVRSIPEKFPSFILTDSDGLKSLPSRNGLRRKIQSLKEDGYLFSPSKKDFLLAGRTEKGAANAAFAFLESLGVRWVMPGKEGEIVPEKPDPLPKKMVAAEPAFPHRGIIFVSAPSDYPMEDWLIFFSHHRMNTIHMMQAPRGTGLKNVCQKYGLRLEVGWHGLSGLLPRKLFSKYPDCFRMLQPEESKTMRTPDYNLCSTSIRGQKIIRNNFSERLKRLPQTWGYHFWPDDLPGGGWCFCSRCRGLTNSDQALLITNLLAEELRKSYTEARIAFLAYHDTVTPSKTVTPAKELFLLYAPRERCYSHSIDDPNCKRNRFYRYCLEGWLENFQNNDEHHIFEYYFDQILFRGLYPFFPKVISADLKYYKKLGIPVMLSLSVGGPVVTPPINMLYYFQATWDPKVSASKLLEDVCEKLGGQFPEELKQYYGTSETAFQNALLFCDYPTELYFDYRCLPENASKFGYQHSLSLQKGAQVLSPWSRKLLASSHKSKSPLSRRILAKESQLAQFHTDELTAMAKQAKAMYYAGSFWAKKKKEDLSKAAQALEATRDNLKKNSKKTRGFLPKNAYYWEINKWLVKEMDRKRKMVQYLSNQ